MLYMEGYGYLIWLLPLRPNVLTRLVAWFHGIYKSVTKKGKRA
jgi:hypothetical protein